MSLVLAGVQRDRRRAERGQGGSGGGGMWFPAANNISATDFRTDTWVHLKTDPHRAWLAANPAHNIFVKAIAELFSLPGNKKREQTEKHKLNPDGAKIQTQHRFSFFAADYQTMAPATLSNLLHTGNLIGNVKMAFVCLNQRKRREQGGGISRGKRGITIRYTQCQSVASSMGLILLECKAAATLTRSLSRQWRENPATGSPLGRGSKRGLRNGPPLFVLLCLLKQTHPPFWWKPCGGGPPWGTDGQMVMGTATGGHATHAHSWCFWIINWW